MDKQHQTRSDRQGAAARPHESQLRAARAAARRRDQLRDHPGPVDELYGPRPGRAIDQDLDLSGVGAYRKPFGKK